MNLELFWRQHSESYFAWILLGLASGYLLARLRAWTQRQPARTVDHLTWLLLATGLYGARLFDRLFYMPHGHWWEPFLVWRGGGMVLYGGIIFGVVSLFLYCWFQQKRAADWLDVFAPSFALGLAMGRIACFVGGQCWGDVCADPGLMPALQEPAIRYQVQTLPSLSPAGLPWGVRYPRRTGAYDQQVELGLIPASASFSLPVHPVQIYEALFALILCVWLNCKFLERTWSGQVFCRLCFAYATGRFFLEFLRADNAPIYWGLTLSQVLSLGIALVSGVLLLTRTWSAKHFAAPVAGLHPPKPGPVAPSE